MEEKRKFPRFALGAEIHWNSVSGAENGSEPQICHSRDMSAGGICLDLDAEIAAGDTLLIEIKISEGQSIFSRGRVAWVNCQVRIKGWEISTREAGIEFLNLTDTEKTAIDNFISRSV